MTRQVLPASRAAAICGLAAPVSFVVGVVLADVVQPAAFSPVNDDISDLGAVTASSPWLYNQVAANLTGILVVGFALGLWAALGNGFLARAGVLGLVSWERAYSSTGCSGWTARASTPAATTRRGTPRRTRSSRGSRRRLFS